MRRGRWTFSSRSCATFPEAHVVVRGHTDRTGAAAANLLLSCRRARAAEAYLLAKGVAPARLAVQGYGEADPEVETEDGVASRKTGGSPSPSPIRRTPPRAPERRGVLSALARAPPATYAAPCASKAPNPMSRPTTSRSRSMPRSPCAGRLLVKGEPGTGQDHPRPRDRRRDRRAADRMARQIDDQGASGPLRI